MQVVGELYGLDMLVSLRQDKREGPADSAALGDNGTFGTYEMGDGQQVDDWITEINYGQK